MSILTQEHEDNARPIRPVTDAGRRLAEAHERARAAGGVGRFIAARLSDGRTDGAIYDTRDDAIRHQLDETQCAYIVVQPAAMPDEEATGLLDVNRRIYAAGMRTTDPDTVNGATIAATLGLSPNRATRRAALRKRR